MEKEPPKEPEKERLLDDAEAQRAFDVGEASRTAPPRLGFTDPIPEGMKCAECDKHAATIRYAEESFEATHFGVTPLCACCYIEHVIASVKERTRWQIKIMRKAAVMSERLGTKFP